MESLYKLSVFINMIDNISQPMAQVSAGVNDTIGQLEKLNSSFASLTKGSIAVAGIGKAFMGAALAPVEATFDTRKALGELSSIGITDLQALEDASRSFSDTWAGTTKADFLGAAYNIKSGISTLSDEAVADFASMAGVTAKATKASVDEMTSLFATGYGIYKGYYDDLSDSQFAEMFSAGISTAVKDFKTSGSGMAQSIQTLGAAATTSNVPLEEQLSVLGMLQATMSGSEAGTKYKAFLQGATKAQKELGLSFVDSNGQLLSMPEILSLLKGKFGETMDAAEKMQLTKAFGTAEAVALVDLLYSKTDELEGNIISMYDTMGGGMGVATDMADAINSTEGEKFDILKQRIQNIVEEIGTGMLPVVNQWMDKGAVLLEQVATWAGENQGLVSTLMLIIAIAGGGMVVLGGLGTIFGFMGSMVTGSVRTFLNFKDVIKGIPGMFDTLHIKALYAGDGIKKGFSAIRGAGSTAVSSIKNVTSSIANMAKTAAVNAWNGLKSMALGLYNMAKQAVITAVQALPGLIASVWSFTAALLANPITWVVVGIIALIAGLYLLWTNWDTVVQFLGGVWNAAVQGAIDTFNWIKDKIAEMPAGVALLIAAFMPFIGIPLLIFQNWESIKEFFSNLWGGITEGFNSFMTEFLPSVLESGKKILDTLAQGISAAVSGPVDAIKGGLAKVREFLPFSDAKEGPLSTLTLSGQRVFETLAFGMEQTANLPSDMAEQAFEQIEKPSLSMADMKEKEPEGLSLREIISEQRENTSQELHTENNKGFSIGQLVMNLNIKDVQELEMAIKLIKEMEGILEGNSAWEVATP